MGGVMISPNVKKTSVRIDTAGNEINPKTKQIVQKVQEEYVVPKEIKTEVLQQITPTSPLSIQQQIEQAEKHLADLKVQKKAEIERMKEQLRELEKE